MLGWANNFSTAKERSRMIHGTELNIAGADPQAKTDADLAVQCREMPAVNKNALMKIEVTAADAYCSGVRPPARQSLSKKYHRTILASMIWRTVSTFGSRVRV